MKPSRFALHVAAFLVTLAAVCALSGSGHTREIQDRLLCHALGIDFAQGEFQVTAQVFKPSGAGSDTPVDITKSNIEVIKGSGRTVSEALRQCENERGKEVFLGHLKLICLGETVSLSQPRSLFEFCLRDRTVYLGVDICLAKSARELLATELSSEMVATENYIDVIGKNAEKSRTVRCRLLDVLSLHSGGSIAMPILSAKLPSENEKLTEPTIQVAGTALYKGGELLPEALGTDDCAAFCMLCGTGTQADILLDAGSEKVSVSLAKGSAKRSVGQGSGGLVYKCSLTVVVHRIKDAASACEPDEIGRRVKAQLSEQFVGLFERCANERACDIFGIAKLLRQRYPSTYLENEGDLDRFYRTARCEVGVECLVE